MPDNADMRAWIIARAGAWRGIVQSVAELRRQRRASVEEALGAVEAYRGLARDLATSRRLAPDSRTTAVTGTVNVSLSGVIIGDTVVVSGGTATPFSSYPLTCP